MLQQKLPTRKLPLLWVVVALQFAVLLLMTYSPKTGATQQINVVSLNGVFLPFIWFLCLLLSTANRLITGQYSFAIGYWDYCLYLDSQKPDYVSLSWQDKQAHLWSQIKADQNIGRYYQEEALTESVKTTFDDEWDVMPNGRHKSIHSVGAICPFKIDIAADSTYTGLLKVF